MRWKAARLVAVLACAAAIFAAAVPAASAQREMVCSRSDNPNLEYVSRDWGAYGYLGLDHFGLDSFWFIANVTGGGAGKWVQWDYIVGVPTAEDMPGGDFTGFNYYGTIFCPGW